ncbi:MAG: DUF3006 domain-containing protein [Chloroflexi bacterium]|nr:DUF3006 domain-containing protein [Chloroflexota bacterium]
MEKAVVDRIEGELAVLLVGDEEREVVVALRDLPPGSEPGVWLKVSVEGDRLREAEVDRETTRAKRSRVQGKMARLLGKRPKQP